jgi:ribosome-binding protein aMBF1 (putative translation factor)
LRVVQNQRERSVADCEDLAADFEHRTAILQEIEQNKAVLQSKINHIQIEIQTIQAQVITEER